jgi:trk system potassium uptake protein TrkH
MASERFITPYTVPVYGFFAVIVLGSILLRQGFSLAAEPLSWIDAVFTATSAVCVTGLIVVDTGSFFTQAGQGVILGLIQLGGLGIMTYTSLVFYLLRRRVSLRDKAALANSLLYDRSFRLNRFLLQVLGTTLCVEALGALLLYLLDGRGFGVFSAVFHAVSAFCNAGFSLQTDSLMQWRAGPFVLAVFSLLIILGGLGFTVMYDIFAKLRSEKWRLFRFNKPKPALSFHTRTVLQATVLLLAAGAVFIALGEMLHGMEHGLFVHILDAVFQSVTTRTAGFNSMDIEALSSFSLLIIILFMFVGGSPGSCAGGVKTTTLWSLWAFCMSQFKGRKQTAIGRVALDENTVNKALTLIMFALGIIVSAVLLLHLTEAEVGPTDRGMSLDLIFEAVSAFATVGLSTGITPELSTAGKCIIIVLMFIGRLGPILFLSLLQEFRRHELFKRSEYSLMIG